MSELRHAGLATLRLLADGQWHTGVAMAKQLGLSRTAIWKQVAALRKLGVQVVADRRRGYRLEYPISLLDADRIRAGLRPPVRAAVDALEVLTVTVSTNLCLSSRPAPPEGRMHVVAADYQTGGRGPPRSPLALAVRPRHLPVGSPKFCLHAARPAGHEPGGRPCRGRGTVRAWR